MTVSWEYFVFDTVGDGPPDAVRREVDGEERRVVVGGRLQRAPLRGDRVQRRRQRGRVVVVARERRVFGRDLRPYKRPFNFTST